ncbi:alpha/beta fold hydrolase [Pseudocolwellia sp. HL-MZ19]|uniref:alpha/beta fold hydrolase n=1 Tax=unclassified Pseudocolwellia TaxID=2848178 RepID=UPI003CE98644
MALLNYTQQGSGPHVILIHGLFGSLENLNMIAKKLRENYTVTSVDVRNHGSSFHENSMSYEELAQDIINVMDHLNIESSDFLGHSMGGKIAMYCALAFPEKVKKLIVADIAPVEYPPHHNQIIEGLKSIDLTLAKNRKDADLQLSKYVEEIGVRQFLLRNVATVNDKLVFKCNVEYISNCYKQIMLGFDDTTSFSGETLFIKGGQSNYILAEHRPKIIALFPNSKAKVIQDAGHWLHAEKTVMFNKIVENFLA